jgi:hypothetical protein
LLLQQEQSLKNKLRIKLRLTALQKKKIKENRAYSVTASVWEARYTIRYNYPCPLSAAYWSYRKKRF